MRFLCRIGIHKWTQWGIFRQAPIYGSVYKTMRYCKECDMVQFGERKISTTEEV